MSEAAVGDVARAPDHPRAAEDVLSSRTHEADVADVRGDEGYLAARNVGVAGQLDGDETA